MTPLCDDNCGSPWTEVPLLAEEGVSAPACCGMCVHPSGAERQRETQPWLRGAGRSQGFLCCSCGICMSGAHGSGAGERAPHPSAPLDPPAFSHLG